MRFLNKTLYRVLLVLFGLAAFFMAVEPFTDTGFVEPLSVIILAVFLFFILRGLYRLLSKKNIKRLKILVFILFVLFIGLQIFSVNVAHLMTFGDPWHMQMQAMRLTQGDYAYDIWIQQYPNLMPLVALNVGFIRLSETLHINYYVIFYAFNIIVTTGIWAVLIRFLWRKKAQLAAFMAVLMIFIPMNYDFLLRVGYSDGLAILSLLTMVLIFDRMIEKQRFSWVQALLSLVLFTVAFLARPNVVVFLIALVIFACLAFYRRKKMAQLWKNCLKMLVACVIGLGLAMGATHAIDKSLHYDANNPNAFPTVNWVYESLNVKSLGEWTPEDRDYTLYHHGYATAKEADIAGIKSRLASMVRQPWQFVILFVGKFATLWSCGTFATGTDYQFFASTYNWTYGPAFLVQNIGAINLFMETYAKALMTVMLFAVVMVLWRKKKVEISAFGISLLTIMGISLFHTFLWEVKPRYQFMTFGLILLVGALSMSEIFSEKFVWKTAVSADKTVGLGKKLYHSRWHRVGAWFVHHKQGLRWCLPIASVLSIVLMLTVMQLQPKQTVVVNAQQHQVDHFGYANGTYELSPGQEISQQIKLPVSADRINLTTSSSENVELILSELTEHGWKQVYSTDVPKEQENLMVDHQMSAGTYQLTIKDTSAQPAKFAVMRDMTTVDVPNPIQLPNGQTGSFQYIVSQSQQASKFPLGVIGLYVVIYLVGNIIFFRKTAKK